MTPIKVLAASLPAEAVRKDETANKPSTVHSGRIEPGIFATTHWSVVLAAGHSSAPGAEEALETLCRTYWYPLYVYVRGQGQSAHDAQDLTQQFFARLLQKKYL